MDEFPPYRGPLQDLFSYKSINKNPQDDREETHYFTKFSSDGVFVDFRRPGLAQNPYGWKMHISLLEDDQNMEKAWNVIFPILINYQIQNSKILRRGNFLQEPQQGKEITIYFQEGAINWAEMFQTIEEKLLSEGVLPDCKPLGDLEIVGSRFLSCRCDVENPAIGYLSNLEVTSHNPSGKPHLFEGLKINCASDVFKPSRRNEDRVKFFYATLQENYLKVLGEFRKRFNRFGSVPIFSSIREDAVNNNYKSFPEEVIVNLKAIIFLGKEIEKMRRMTGHVIEKMDKATYQIYCDEMLEKFKRMEGLIYYVFDLMRDNPESAQNSSEDSVVRRDSYGKIKDSSSEEVLAKPVNFTPTGLVNAKRSSSEESSSFSDDFKRRSDEAEESPRTSGNDVNKIQPKSTGPRK